MLHSMDTNDSATKITAALSAASGKQPVQGEGVTFESFSEADYDVEVVDKDLYFELYRLYRFHEKELEAFEDLKLAQVELNVTHSDRSLHCNKHDPYYPLFLTFFEYCESDIDHFDDFKPLLSKILAEKAPSGDEGFEPYRALYDFFVEYRTKVRAYGKIATFLCEVDAPEPDQLVKFAAWCTTCDIDPNTDRKLLARQMTSGKVVDYSSLEIFKAQLKALELECIDTLLAAKHGTHTFPQAAQNQQYLRSLTEHMIITMEDKIRASGVREFVAFFPKVIAVNEPVHGKPESEDMSRDAVNALYTQLSSSDEPPAFTVTSI